MRVTLLLLFLIGIQILVNGQAISGFSESNAEAQREAEKRFDAALSAANLNAWMKKLAARPHHVGSGFGKESAEFIRDQFQSWGYQAEIETFHVLFPTPRTRVLEMTAPGRFKARLAEMPLKQDATSGQTKEQLPVYNCFSADGDVTAELVYVNYGLPEDYEYLEQVGIDVKGKIVIARYGRSWRGIKPKVAEERGAIGCIIYSDPIEDGYAQGDVYPEGPFKNSSGAQRGSVIDLPVAPGDPTTPGYASTKDAKRIERSDAINLLKIPVLPISYADAQPLLAALRGPVAPAHWRGALPITYHLGPGETKVHLKLTFDWNIVPCYNVIARMAGSTHPDQWVIRGNHHDAWVNGASDPVSGVVAMMEEARALSELAKTGWRPRRTIIYCAWDAEEPGLIGSTEWVEAHQDELTQKAVVYINSDGNSRGFLYAGGSHTLESLMTEIARDVSDPQTKISVFERSKSRQAMNAANAKARTEILNRKHLQLGALGSGSDYSPFIQHLGIPSLNLAYSGEGSGGEYHSIFDSYDHYVRFKDPDFDYGVALAKTAGRATMRLANADRLPFDFQRFHRTVANYLTEVTSLLDNMRQDTEVENQMIDEKRFIHAADPTKTFHAPEKNDPVPYLDFSPLQNALASLERAAQAFTDSIDDNDLNPDNLQALNKLIYQCEHALLVNGGLPRRPWYRHTIYAPGYYTGYGVKTLPGIREAIEQRNWEEAREQISIASAALQAYTARIHEANELLQQAD
ncbi:MAG TPA: transferrin receptor-like dimerization domain-containing protein [Chryseosolibacter sp.]|nr:transferrin receptor-like dimerization domain-containing protein [Chryseosolibacter sp.]